MKNQLVAAFYTHLRRSSIIFHWRLYLLTIIAYRRIDRSNAIILRFVGQVLRVTLGGRGVFVVKFFSAPHDTAADHRKCFVDVSETAMARWNNNNC